MHIALKVVILSIVSYLLGNINFARILARTRNDDITKHGSGNPGTMNMLRNHGVILGALTLLFDAVKCIIPCLVARLWLFEGDAYWSNLGVHIAGFFGIIGHMFPVVYKFKGGKGIASAFGFALVANPILAACCFVVFAITFVISKMGSLGSLASLFTFSIVNTIFLAKNGYYLSIAITWVLVLLISFAHRSNISRLLGNKESKISLQDAVEKDKAYLKAQREKRQKQHKQETQPDSADNANKNDELSGEKNTENK